MLCDVFEVVPRLHKIHIFSFLFFGEFWNASARLGYWQTVARISCIDNQDQTLPALCNVWR